MAIGYAEIVASLALLVSFGSLALHWLAWRREQAIHSPIVGVETVKDERFAHPWHLIRVTLRSRSNEGVTMTELRIDRPKGAGIIPYWDAMELNPEGEWHAPVAKLPRSPGNVVGPKLEVAHEGSIVEFFGGGFIRMGSGDFHHEDFLVMLPESRQTSTSTSRIASSVRLTAFLISQTQARKRKAWPSKHTIHIQIITAASQ